MTHPQHPPAPIHPGAAATQPAGFIPGESGPRPVSPEPTVLPFEPTGFFREPLWLRLPIVVFIFPVAFAILAASWEVVASREPFLVLVALFALEPLGVFLLLACGALVSPRSAFGRWFQLRRRSVGLLITLWVVAYTVIAVVVSLGLAH